MKSFKQFLNKRLLKTKKNKRKYLCQDMKMFSKENCYVKT